MAIEYVELYRCVVPANRLINDNHSQHYRTHQGNLNWLTSQFNEILQNDRNKREDGVVDYMIAPFGFSIPSKEEIQLFIKNSPNINLRCEVWRPREIAFDPQNYAKTFKAPIDLLVYNEYIPDDNWKNIAGITYCGGGGSVWQKRAWRKEGDGLPNELNAEIWKTIAKDYGDIFIRILLFKSEE